MSHSFPEPKSPPFDSRRMGAGHLFPNADRTGDGFATQMGNNFHRNPDEGATHRCDQSARPHSARPAACQRQVSAPGDM